MQISDIPRSLKLDCNHTAELISLARDHQVGFWRRLQIRVHNLYCENCRAFERFVETAGVLIKKRKAPALTDDARARILAAASRTNGEKV